MISGGWGGSGGWQLQNNTPGKEYYPNGIPVGALLSVGAYQGNSRWVIDTTTINWGGGTYKSYFSSPATTQGLATTSVGKIAAADRTASGFTVIADPDTSNLVITLTCKYYKNPNNKAAGDTSQVSATLSAQVIKPTVSFSGTPGTKVFSNDGTNASITLNPPETLTAKTTTKAFGGNFMMSQFYAPTGNAPTVFMSYQDSAAAGGKVWSVSTVGNGLNLDDGGINYSVPIGGYIDGGNTASGWTMNANSGPVTHTQTDPPYISVSSTAQWLSLNDNFKSYLMYQPSSGVWVALAENDWSFVWKVTNSPWPAPGAAGQAGANTPSTPSGDNAFPSWTGNVANRPFQ